jgi:SAM-dependent methyltransferase
MSSTARLYIRRISHSLSERGLWATLQALRNFLADYLFDLRYATDTMRWVPLESLTIRSSNVGQGNRYQATKYLHLKRFLDHFAFPAGSVFVDLGSGKGRVLLVAARYPFKRVVGIEFAAELCAIARRNCDIFRRKVHGLAPIEVIEGDVLQHQIQPDENVFFMYHPFHTQVLQEVLARIAQSARLHPRPVFLIYHAPIYQDLVRSTPPFVELNSVSLDEAVFTLFGIGVSPSSTFNDKPAIESPSPALRQAGARKEAGS